jgi:hypothetical protein
MTSIVLRAVAIGIAVAGFLDPAFTSAGRAHARVSIVVQDGSTMELPAAGGSSRRASAERVRDRLAKNLGGDYDIQPRLTSDAAAVVVIGDRYPDSSLAPAINAETAETAEKTRSASSAGSALPSGTPVVSVSTVDVSDEVSPDVRIVRLDAPRDVPAGTAFRVGVDVEGTGVAGASSTLTLRVGDLEVGRASHRWRGERDRWHAEIEAVPVGEPPFVVHVQAEPLERERTRIDNEADTIVDLRRGPIRVEVYEPRPSWATAFIRRALEADPRFHVASLSATSKSVATRTGDAAALGDPAFETFDVVIAGGLDRLTERDVRALERFMRERGGAVVLAPDARIDTGPAHELLRDVTPIERLSEQPEKLTVVSPLAPIQASELLLMRGESPFVDRIATTSGSDPSSVVVSMPRGDGRLVVSGALDAWRFRAEDDGAFDRFWQSTVAGLALAVPPPADVTIVPAILKPGERGELIVRARGVQTGVRASIDGQPIRLWPEAESGLFRGSFAAPDNDGRSTIVAQIDGPIRRVASRTVVIRSGAQRPLPAAVAPLSLLSSSHQGIHVTPENTSALEQFIRRTVAPPSATVTRRPMRSPWWMIPFVMCLSAEWWLRRRAGLR